MNCSIFCAFYLGLPALFMYRLKLVLGFSHSCFVAFDRELIIQKCLACLGFSRWNYVEMQIISCYGKVLKFLAKEPWWKSLLSSSCSSCWWRLIQSLQRARCHMIHCEKLPMQQPLVPRIRFPGTPPPSEGITTPLQIPGDLRHAWCDSSPSIYLCMYISTSVSSNYGVMSCWG
jgi:hypothetical protein